MFEERLKYLEDAIETAVKAVPQQAIAAHIELARMDGQVKGMRRIIDAVPDRLCPEQIHKALHTFEEWFTVHYEELSLLLERKGARRAAKGWPDKPS